ncbi:MAG: PEP-CTERM sorting domain-containing protein, partial [Spirulina sp.]
PFSGNSFDYFFLEDFEDGLFNTPGVSADVGFVTSEQFIGGRDSVDADDGVIDGSGLAGDSYFSFGGNAGINFSFDAGVLGSLPDSVGIVWTDGGGNTTFEAFGPGNISLGTIGPVRIGDRSFNGGTSEDHFFGIEGLGPIESIFIRNGGGGIEVDHLQYGSTQSVPEPSSIIGILVIGASSFWLGRKKKAKIRG